MAEPTLRRGYTKTLNEILRGSKKKKKVEERKIYEHQQTVVPHTKAPQVGRGLFGYPSTVEPLLSGHFLKPRIISVSLYCSI